MSNVLMDYFYAGQDSTAILLLMTMNH